MDKNPIESRLKTIEWRLNILIGVSIVQVVLLSVIAIGYFFPSAFTLISMCILLVIFLFAFHKQIPNWLGSFTRYLFSQLLDSQKTDSAKEMK